MYRSAIIDMNLPKYPGNAEASTAVLAKRRQRRVLAVGLKLLYYPDMKRSLRRQRRRQHRVMNGWQVDDVSRILLNMGRDISGSGQQAFFSAASTPRRRTLLVTSASRDGTSWPETCLAAASHTCVP